MREQTATIHSELDRLVGNFDCRESYQRYVIGMARFRLSAESLWRVNRLQDWRPTLLGQDLGRDLVALSAEIGAFPVMAAPVSRAGWLGMGYVLEGACLGARLLVRRAATLGLTAETGAAHLHRQTDSLSNWHRLGALLEQAEEIDERPMIASAKATFALAQAAFESASNVSTPAC
ncbi:biliverdin-producing heme oxygenase [Allorhizobium sp. BGMRC 0089]|uniref:biliverdin-producing heme oxygenase n=1 Tax=Allorhizobium sonneratiae TaxID=2934936 RepID=UPI0020332181|nr:biliverdin-producing heme oxygenase [Allorhizobium sonneratiae]MCM2291013.1 biliverdin-producing heme oxygenase [Allorhizobium sonneratiae]